MSRQDPDGKPQRDAPQPARAFRDGALGALPFIVVAVPFGMLFGVVATEAGLNLLETMVMTSFVIAGASQFAFVELLNQGAPALVALAAALAVNLRMAMYSASLAPHLGGASGRVRLLMAYMLVDQTYGLAIRRFTDRPRMALSEKVAYFIGAAVPVMPCWIGATFAGAVAGGAIPDSLSIDFAPPATFIAIFAPMLRGAANWAAALVAIAFALLLDGLPWSLGLLAAAALGMATGALVEIRLARLRAARGEALHA
ncbi:MAG: AzlC family ABC transporter permease [Pseudomonadota bacterium]